jgi:hypothetical protein
VLGGILEILRWSRSWRRLEAWLQENFLYEWTENDRKANHRREERMKYWRVMFCLLSFFALLYLILSLQDEFLLFGGDERVLLCSLEVHSFVPNSLHCYMRLIGWTPPIFDLDTDELSMNILLDRTKPVFDDLRVYVPSPETSNCPHKVSRMCYSQVQDMVRYPASTSRNSSISVATIKIRVVKEGTSCP